MALYPQLDDRDWLLARYEEDGMSTTQIAALAGVLNDNHATVRRALLRHGVNIRRPADGRRLRAAKMPAPTYTEKPCTRCKQIKPLTEFHLLRTMRDGRASHCKRCAADMSNAGTKKQRLLVIEALGGACMGCGVDDPRVLAIDHINGGGGPARKGVNPYTYYKAMLSDLPSVQVLCHNCNHLKRLDKREHRKALT